MRKIPRRRRYHRLFGSDAAADAHDELENHIAFRVEDLMRQGQTEAEARAQAEREFGDVTRIRREMNKLGRKRRRRERRAALWQSLSQDIPYAVRSLRRTPGFTIAALLILALGIGMSTAMFTVFKTVLVDRLPIRAQGGVVVMHTLDRSGRNLDAPNAYLAEIARDSAHFRGVAGVHHLVRPQPFMNGSAVVVLTVAGASTNYFDILGMRPVAGRFLRPEDEQAGAPPVIVLSYAAWRRDFGGDPSVVGHPLVIPYTQERARIIGVAPPGFEYPTGADVWMAIPQEASMLQVDIVARLAPNVTIDMARAGLFALTQRVNPFASLPQIRDEPPGNWEIAGVAAQSFADTVLGGSRPSIVALTLAVGLLLLIACVNIGNLSLVRLLGRSREIAVRRAIGARATDIVRLFAVENALLGTLGGGLGFPTAVALLRIVRAAAPPQLPRIDALSSLGAPFAAAAGITLFALLLFGALPSLMASRIRSYAALRADSRSGTEKRSARRARYGLVAMQIALAVVMLNGAGLLVRTLARLESVDLGYRSDHLSILSFTGKQSAFPTSAAQGEIGKQLVRRLEATPGVVAATPIMSEPFKGQSLYLIKLARVEQPVTERAQNPFVPFEWVGSSYFRTFAIPILRGRGFTASDTRGSERVVVVNERFANLLWPDQDPLGKRVVPVARDTPFTVVGVASDTRFRELRNVGPVAYFVRDQVSPGWDGLLAVRTTRPLADMLPALRAASHDVNPALVLWNAETMDQLLDAPLAQPRLSALLLASFSLVALLLSAIGLYGVVASGVRRQRHDIGVRVALGAMPGNIRRLVFAQVLGLAGVGVMAGLAGALGASRLLRSMLFQVSPIDALTLAGVCVLLLAVATVAGYLPAHRAARIDPIEALRAQ